MARSKPNLTPEEIKVRSAMWVKNWRDNNPEKQKLARKRAYNNRKLKAFKMIGEPKCANCGCDELDFLEFNHIDGGGCKEWRDSITYSSMADKLLTGKRKPEGLEILCRVCNALDFLNRKNIESSKKFKIIWQN
jgi:hypothetical protein